jgi:hypothetical protein
MNSPNKIELFDANIYCFVVEIDANINYFFSSTEFRRLSPTFLKQGPKNKKNKVWVQNQLFP